MARASGATAMGPRPTDLSTRNCAMPSKAKTAIDDGVDGDADDGSGYGVSERGGLGMLFMLRM